MSVFALISSKFLIISKSLRSLKERRILIKGTVDILILELPQNPCLAELREPGFLILIVELSHKIIVIHGYHSLQRGQEVTRVNLNKWDIRKHNFALVLALLLLH